jgi:glycosyltransferase involved in cell wall biosynthesis
MRIAQIAPLLEPVPPKYYGGTERVIFYLVEELVSRGHEVTLFASGDSQTTAELVPACEKALRHSSNCHEEVAHHSFMIEKLSQSASRFDVIHFHLAYLHLSLARTLRTASVTTMHDRLDMSHLLRLLDEFRDAPLVSVSKSQQRTMPWLNWQNTVHPGLPLHLYSLTSQPENYLLFMGKISPEKRLDRAIEIAKLAGIPLKIAAKIDKQDEEYFKHTIKPLLKQSNVEFLEEVSEGQKNVLLSKAKALISTSEYTEPFRIAFIEGLACGTPILAIRNGSVAEIVKDGVTGFLCNDVAAAAQAAQKLGNLNRKDCREDFELRFSAARMADDYLRVYEKLVLSHDVPSYPRANSELSVVHPWDTDPQSLSSDSNFLFS